MSRTVARLLLATSSILAFTFLLTPAGPLAARGRGPSALQPDSSAVIFTMVLKRDEPVSRRNFLILPTPNSHASPYAKGGNSTGGGGGTKGGGGGGKGGGGGTSGGGGGSTGGGGTSPCCGGNLSLSFNGSAYGFGSTTVETPTTTQPEAEEEIAADPTDPTGKSLVAAISDFSSSAGYNNTKWALSTDGGGIWSENFVPNNPVSHQLLTNGSVIQGWSANSDPVLAFGKNIGGSGENVYLSDLYLNVDASTGEITGEGLYVSTATFSHLSTAHTFATLDSSGAITSPNTYPVMTNLSNGSTFNIEDKPWITVDQNTGTVYVSWSHFTGCQNQYNPLVGAYVLTCSSDSIYLSYSTDNGHTWLKTPIQISPSTQDGAVQGSQPAVGPNGTVYVTYELMGSNNQRQQYLAVSTGSATDGSLTFSTYAPFSVSPVFYELTFSGCNTCTASYRVNSFPNIAVGPLTGNVYLVYGAQADAASYAQVNFMACTASCTSSSSFYGPSILDDDPNDSAEHFFPAIAVDPNGVIDTSWLDTRGSGSATSPTDPDALNVYATYLNYKSGVTFTAAPNARVTPTTNYAYTLIGGFNFADTSFIGDYIGIAATPTGAAYPAWTNVSGYLGYPITGTLQTRPLLP